MKEQPDAKYYFQKTTQVYLLLMAVLYPLYFGFRGYETITASKYPLFLLLSGGYLLFMAIMALLNGVRIPNPRQLWLRFSLRQKLALLYLFITWISAFASPYFPQTVVGASRYEGALTISLYVLCFLLVSIYGSADGKLLAAVSAASVVFSVLCLIQLLGKNPFDLYPYGSSYYDAYKLYSGAYLGTIGNVDLCASYLCVTIPVCWVSLLRIRNPRRWLLLIPLTLSLTVLFWMNVAAGIMGILLGGLLGIPVVLPLEKRRRRTVFLFTIGILVLSVAAVFVFDPGSGSLHEAHMILHGKIEDSFGSSRIGIWRSVLGNVHAHWLLGWGPDTMRFAELTIASRYDENLGGIIVSRLDTAHNEYLNILFHQGIFAVSVYLAFLVLILLHWIHRAPESGTTASAGCAVLCYAIQAFFGISQFITAPFFFLSLALTENGSYCSPDKRHRSVRKKPKLK